MDNSVLQRGSHSAYVNCKSDWTAETTEPKREQIYGFSTSGKVYSEIWSWWSPHFARYFFLLQRNRVNR